MKRNRPSLGISIDSTRPVQITEVARLAGIRHDEIRSFGSYKAKVGPSVIERFRARPNGRLIVVAGMTPSPQGGGKTVTAIGLTQALGLLKKKVMLCLRDPSHAFSLCPRGCGTGYSQIVPSEEILIHFTGDSHAIQSATNFLAALVSTRIRASGDRKKETPRIFWRPAIDAADDRLLNSFDPSCGSELTGLLTLTHSLSNLKERLGRILIGLDANHRPLRAADFKAVGPLTVYLKDALEPNLVQTLEGQPCLLHAGSTADLSIGSPSILATSLALKLSDYGVTVTGQGTELGLEKFFHLVLPQADFEANLVLLVVGQRELKAHSETSWNPGFENVKRHLSNIRRFGFEPVVAINRYPEDSESDLKRISDFLNSLGASWAVSSAASQGGAGCLELAERVIRTLSKRKDELRPVVDPHGPFEERCRILAQTLYGADAVEFSPQALEDLALLKDLELDALPMHIVKTPYSLSDHESLKGSPKNWKLRISSLRPMAGAGFITVMTGSPSRVPPWTQSSIFDELDVDPSGRVIGIGAA